MPLGLVHDPIFQQHDPGDYHPESPKRLAVLERALANWPGYKQAQRIPLRKAKDEELARVHQKSHISRIASTEGRSMALDMDTHTSPGSYDAALKAAGTLIDLCDAALDGKVTHGMAFVRPPGHHATPVRAMGFCLFNNVAVAAAHLIQARGLERILIVDWDVHHGNGTEDAFYMDPKVLYFSTHQAPFYPGTGPVNAAGREAGEGFTINVPLSSGHDDSDYIRIFEDLLAPVARQFKPQFILISAGFDAHREDPLGGEGLSSMGYAAMTRVLMEIADEFCPGCVVGVLEGGYNPEAEARAGIAAMDALLGSKDADKLRHAAQSVDQPHPLKEAIAVQQRFWRLNSNDIDELEM
jgi:acetoin utilization deacetylase AcuC-like enzyme